MSEEKSNDQLHEEMESLKTDLHKLQGDLRGMAEKVMGLGRDSAEHYRSQAVHSMEEGMQRVNQYVEEKPLATLAGAFVVGLVVGLIFGRK